MKMQSLALALAAAVLAVPAVAADETPGIRVHYGDLDLTSDAGQKELDSRLNRAAREVCGVDEPIVGSRISSGHSRTCYREARRQIDVQFAQLVSRKSAGG